MADPAPSRSTPVVPEPFTALPPAPPLTSPAVAGPFSTEDYDPADAPQSRLAAASPAAGHEAPLTRISQTPAGSLPAAPVVGLKLQGYEILGELGRGGMGVVYKARHLTLNRLVALKMILAGGRAHPQLFERFLSEARAVARLHHPNIVQIHEVGTEDGLPYFALDFVAGGSLDRKLAGMPQLPGESAALTETLARAMHHAHQRNLVHRDLKPANVLLQPIDNDRWTAAGPTNLGSLPLTAFLPRITDFGLAKQLDEASGQTQSGAILGTPSYMAPEQATGRIRDIGPAADVYALGAILYELLTGRPPFRGTSMLETLEQVRTREPVPPRSLQPKVPRDLELICLKCLNKEVRKRYPDAEQLAEELRRFRTGEPLVHTRPVGRPERIWRWCRRNRAPTAVIGLFCVTALLAITFAANKMADADVIGKALTRAQNKEQEALINEQTALRNKEEKEVQLAENYLGRGHALGEQGQVGAGMLWLARGLAEAPTQAADIRWALRANLALFRERLPALHGMYAASAASMPVRISPDSRFLFMMSPHNGTQVRPVVIDAQSGAELGRLSQRFVGRMEQVLFAPDSSRLLILAQKAFTLWEVPSGKLVATLRPPEKSFSFRPAAFSPDGRSFVTAASGDEGKGVIQAWDSATGTAQKPALTPASGVDLLSFAPDGKSFYWTEAGRPVLHRTDAATATPIGGPTGFDGDGTIRAISPDARWAAVYDGVGVQVWEVPTARRVGRQLSHTVGNRNPVFSPDSRVLATLNYGGIGLWQLAKLADVDANAGVLLPFIEGVKLFTFSPDGKLLVTVDAGATWARLWDADTGKPLAQAFPHREPCTSLSFNANGSWMATADKAQARLWRVDGAKIRGVPEQVWSYATLIDEAGKKVNLVDYLPAVVVSSDRKTVLLGGKDGRARLFDSATGQLKGPPRDLGSHINGAAMRPDGKVYLTGHNMVAFLWDTETGQQLGPPLKGVHRSFIFRAAISADGKKVVTGSRDHTAQLWDAATGKPLGEPLRHGNDVSAVAFSPDGSLVATGSDDHTVSLWNAETGRPLGESLPQPGIVRSVGFHPNGRMLRVACLGHSVRYWDAVTRKPIGLPVQVAGEWQDVPDSLPGEPEQIGVWVQAITGLELDPRTEALRVLGAEAWQKRVQRLKELGGAPVQTP